MSTALQFEATVISGLPVLVDASVWPAEPDVGIANKQVEIDCIRWLNGKEVTQAVYDRIDRKDMEALRLRALELGDEHDW